ncbi:uncharacterized protein LOC128396696 [Panonychus citri]|uniref:uncharacterized protein LOC128391252 n=1 Tax=Panonychus citri TaxID=50023 RepID=UPI002307A139|nr:uncharacterized protein LOC128391252 [Panonychus citri]XP_053207081.1 uncharacterized protein LOC128391252 [Panonychus citri]XP_053207082.1 uncharacterized protein LOC128391252 [Panonychus citri]XP_053213286.1 uncharacterized protein LOC128396696 [Panonychus citri]XP_053213287.1 uncharacterized protein LOC128396696 [Panonychus citri]XP_053213288.1 uncharacterized protein LOC128396696 [Panonychus citri]XP_053213289.1 uncharacterized protein LOC128396696 [Panonychus citri]
MDWPHQFLRLSIVTKVRLIAMILMNLFCLSIICSGPSNWPRPRIISASRVRSTEETRPTPTLHPYADVPIAGRLNIDLDRTFSRSTCLMKPKRIGYFSLRIDKELNKEIYLPDKSQLRYLSLLKRGSNRLNLLKYFDPKTVWSRCPSDLHILRWYMDNKIDFILDETLSNLEPNFITDIRSLTTIMSSPYDKWNDWDIIGVKIGDKIILHEVDTTMRKNYIARQTDTQNASSYAGYKFESLVTRRFDGKKCSTYYGGLRDSFHGVLVTKVGQHNILYNSRYCCAKNKSQLDAALNDMEFVEIKTQYGSRAWHSRLVGLWARSILANTDFTIVGQRDEDFKVDLAKVKWYYTDKMPSARNHWSPKTMVECLLSTMDFIKSQIIESNIVYRFNHSHGNPIVCQQLDEPFTKFIPDWYVDC